MVALYNVRVGQISESVYNDSLLPTAHLCFFAGLVPHTCFQHTLLILLLHLWLLVSQLRPIPTLQSSLCRPYIVALDEVDEKILGELDDDIDAVWV